MPIKRKSNHVLVNCTSEGYTYRLMRVVKLCIWPPLAMIGNTLLKGVEKVGWKGSRFGGGMGYRNLLSVEDLVPCNPQVHLGELKMKKTKCREAPEVPAPGPQRQRYVCMLRPSHTRGMTSPCIFGILITRSTLRCPRLLIHLMFMFFLFARTIGVTLFVEHGWKCIRASPDGRH